MLSAVALLWACNGDEHPPPAPAPAPAPVVAERLSSDALTVRVSMAVRGVRPTVDELDQVAADPAALATLLDGWLTSPAFGATLRDLHADAWGLRADAEEQWPPLGPLAAYSQSEVATSLGDEPLRLVEAVVLSGRPYTDILTTDEVFSDEITGLANPIARDPGPGWTTGHWTDGRPNAGILASTAVWRRHSTNLSGRQRQRGLFIAQRLLCDDLRTRDFPVIPLDGITSQEAVDDAVGTNPNCVACHATLDPLSAFFWGFDGYLLGADVTRAYEAGCAFAEADTCYPVYFYQPQQEDDWALFGVAGPGFYGQQGETIADLAALVAADPRFARCTAKRFEGWFTQVDWSAVSEPRTDELTEIFTASHLDARELVKAIVLGEAYAAARPALGEGVPLLAVRPEAYARTLEDLTGLTWNASPDAANCEATGACWGSFELMLGSRYGYRVLAGGSDGVFIPAAPESSPARVAALSGMAADLAGQVVALDLDGATPPRLLTAVDATTTDEQAIRAQLAALHLRILGERVDTSSDVVSETWELWRAEADRTDPATAWKLTMYALFTDPLLWLY